MEKLIRDIVQYKKCLEKQIEKKKSLKWFQRMKLSLRGIAGQCHSGYSVAIIPSSFAQHVFPFSEISYSYNSMKIMEIDPFLVLGGAYNKYNKNSKEEKNIIQTLNQITENFANREIRGHPELARYCKIGNFPIFIAVEGKNRAELFRIHNKRIKAMVTETSYPSPSEIIILKTKPFGIFYAKHTGNNKVVLLFPDLTIPVLKKYGVKIIDGEINFQSIIDYRLAMKTLTKKQMLA